jgi:hypothetical protein
MRIRYFAGLVLAIGIILTSCKSKVSSQDASKDALLVLIDKTISSAPNEARQGIFTENTAKAISSILQNPGDMVQGHFIQQNTAGATAFLRSKPVPIYEAPKIGGGKSIKDAEFRHKSKLNLLRGACNIKLREAVEESNTGSTSLYTDLWGILEVATRAFKQDAYDTKTIHILSDMQESMTGAGRRDFHKTPIQSKSEAIAFAKSDAKTLQQLLDVDPAVLAGTRVVIFPPYDALEASDFALNRYYWEALFEAFGISDVQVK